MGLLDVIDSLELSDEQKEQLRREHESEVGTIQSENQTLKRARKTEAVEAEVKALGDMGFAEEAPGLLAWVRRVYLSDDEGPGLVLLSDSELNLSGDQATGASGKEEITVANAVRKFIELMPKNQEGKLKVALSDQASLSDDHSRPGNGDEGETNAEDEHRQSAAGWSGQGEVKRDRTRYDRTKRNGRAATTAGGAS